MRFVIFNLTEMIVKITKVIVFLCLSWPVGGRKLMWADGKTPARELVFMMN